ncbi:MAG: YkvA family protein [Granulosicoccus sp.]
MLKWLREQAQRLKRFALTVWFIARDRRTSWYVRVLAYGIAGYAFSPIDLIPDFIPVLGLVDDLIIVPAGMALVLRLAPAIVLDSARQQAEALAAQPTSPVATMVIAIIWLVLLVLAWQLFAGRLFTWWAL